MIKGLFFIGLFVGGIHVAYVFTSPMIKNTMLEKKMRDTTRTLTAKSEASVRKEIMEFIHEKNIDIHESEIVVVLNDNKITIAGHYSTEASFLNYIRQYEFFPASHDAARLTWRRRAS